MNYQTLTEEELLQHQQHFIDFAKNDIEYFKFIPAKLRNQKEFILNFIKYFEEYEVDPINPAIYSKPYVASYCKEMLATSLTLNNDREVVMKLAEKSISCLYHASDELKNDKEIALVAIKGHIENRVDSSHFSHYSLNVFSNEIKEKIFTMNSYSEIVNWLESELLYKELNEDLPSNNIEKKKVKI